MLLRWQDANNQWQQLTNNLGMAIQLAQEAISTVDKRQVMVQASIEYQCKVLQDVEALREYIYSLLTALKWRSYLMKWKYKFYRKRPLATNLEHRRKY